MLADLDLSVPAGQRVLLVGASGSGKSTLLRAIAGLLETADAGELSGTVTVDGASPAARPGTVGLVLQEPGAGVVAATVGRDVAFGLENIGMPSAAMPPRVASALASVGLSDELALGGDTPTSALSGGQTQRLAMAGALALEPSVLLLDEPTAMLDPASAGAVRAAVDALVRERALTLVVVEHVLGPWVDLVDRVVALDGQGRIVADGPVREVLTQQRETLLDLGIWVPGAGAPAPLTVDAGRCLLPAPHTPPSPSHPAPPVPDRAPPVPDRAPPVPDPSPPVPHPSPPVPDRAPPVPDPSPPVPDRAPPVPDPSPPVPHPSKEAGGPGRPASSGPGTSFDGAAPEVLMPGVPIAASPLVVTRRTATVDGIEVSRVAARTERPIAPRPTALIALVGPSGSGKSTVLHALAGFLRPTEGSVRVHEGSVRVHEGSVRVDSAPATSPDDATGAGMVMGPRAASPDDVTGAGMVMGPRAGRDPADLTPRDLASVLAWIPQWASSTIVTSRVLDEVMATSRNLGRGGLEAEAGARALLEHLGLAHLADADPRHLSGGELRRLAVAAAVHHGPAIVLADEPTIGQDRHTWAAVVGLLAAYRASGGAIVTATHDSFVIDRAAEVHVLAAPSDLTGEGEPRGRPRGKPWLAGRSPLALLIGSALAVPAGVLSPTWRTSLPLVVLQVVLAIAGLTSRRAGLTRPLRAWGVRLVPGLLAAVSVGWSTWLLGGHRLDLAATGVTRVLLIVLPSSVLLPFIDTARLADDLGQRLRLPDRPVVAVAAALQRGQDFAAIWEELARARRVRGLGPSWRRPLTVLTQVAALTLGLLIRSLRAAAELAVAMDARGFATARARTWAEPSRWTLRDSLLVILAALPLAALVALPLAAPAAMPLVGP